jgi:regulator of Ty1 transposition protein 109
LGRDAPSRLPNRSRAPTFTNSQIECTLPYFGDFFNMAGHERPIIATSIASSLLLERLAIVLPKDVSFQIHHLSSPPTRTSAIYSAPPGTRPDRTYCESHFLTASIRPSLAAKAEDVLVFAIEILIYSTAYETTFFVCKADSTGYLHLLKLPKGNSSPLKDISATFLHHLVEHRSRPNVKSVISLFARAQDQYLFPGSVEYQGKHVLDDRGLVRWWCRVLDPIVKETQMGSESIGSKWEQVKGYLVVPGLDIYETNAYIPKSQPTHGKLWKVGHPLREISHHQNDVPPRCLVPHFPDDPKARFLDELDDEITSSEESSSGQWKSVRTIEQFWEMMAYRQECSAGRMVGFIWIVFMPKHEQSALPPQKGADLEETQPSLSSSKYIGDYPSSNIDPGSSFGPLISPLTSFTASSQFQPLSPPAEDSQLTDGQAPTTSRSLLKPGRKPKKKKKLTGPITPRQPKIKTQTNDQHFDIPETTAYYHWPKLGRGQIVVEESDYKRNTELLLRLDFANLELATSSSRRWINEVRSGTSGSKRNAWGQIVVGKKVEQRDATSVVSGSSINVISIKKKRKVEDEETQASPAVPAAPAASTTTPVNVLGAGMIRKKAKV